MYTKCELISCSDLKPGKCSEAQFSDRNKQCVESEDGKRCEVKKCSDVNPNECNQFIIPNYDSYKCIKEGDGCVVKDCSKLTPPNCDAINPMKNNLYTCADNGDFCEETIKRCEDLPPQYCGLYSQSLFYSKERNGKCIKNEKTQKCELRTCETTPSTECNSFILNDEDEICALNSEENKCEIVKCSN